MWYEEACGEFCELRGAHCERQSSKQTAVSFARQFWTQPSAHSGSSAVWPASWITKAKPSPPRNSQSMSSVPGRSSWLGYAPAPGPSPTPVPAPAHRSEGYPSLKVNVVLKPACTRCLCLCQAAPFLSSTDEVSRSALVQAATSWSNSGSGGSYVLFATQAWTHVSNGSSPGKHTR